jgi:hypothetical protein
MVDKSGLNETTHLLSVAKDNDVNATYSLYTLKDSDDPCIERSRHRDVRCH